MAVDYAALKPTVTKDDAPGPSKKYRRKPRPNPAQNSYDLGVKNFGKWVEVTLPGKSVEKMNASGRNVIDYGPEVTTFCSLMRTAASNDDAPEQRTMNFRYEDKGDGRILVWYRVAPRKSRAA